MDNRNELAYELKISGQMINDVLYYKTFHSVFNPISKMEIGLNNTERKYTDVLKKENEVSFIAGYLRQTESKIFKGKISAIDGTEVIKITVKNEIYFKESDDKLFYRGSFNDVNPGQLINHIFLKAGIDPKNVKLSKHNYVSKSHFWFKGESFIEAIRAVDRAWGIESKLSIVDDVWYWNSKPDEEETKKDILFVEDENLYSVTYKDGKGMAEVYPPALGLKVESKFKIYKNDVPKTDFIVDEILHKYNGESSNYTGIDGQPHSVIYFSIDPVLISKRKKRYLKKTNTKASESAILSVVSKETEGLKNKQETIEASIISVSGDGPYVLSVLPVDTDEDGEILPIIKEIAFDNQKIFRVPIVGDSIKIGFINADQTSPYVADYGSVFDSSNKSYLDSSDIFHFVSEGNDIILKKQAAVAAPAGGATVDAEARTAINGLRDILTNLNLM